MSRILLVEDEQVNRDLFRRRLERKGYQVLTAETGLQAVALTTSELPDLVLMDLGLPELDGWQATQRIKSNPATAVVPVIALSAHATVEAKQKAFAAGCQEFETKPVNWEVLFGKIVKALEARIMPVADNAPAPGTVPPGSPGPDKTSAARLSRNSTRRDRGLSKEAGRTTRTETHSRRRGQRRQPGHAVPAIEQEWLRHDRGPRRP